MKFSQNGLSLIEVIMSMWIVGLIVFSTMVCTSDIETKMDQRKIQALSLAKSELDKLRYWALKGFLMLNEGTDTESTRNYTMIVWALDRKKVKFDQDTGDIADLGERLENMSTLALIYDTYNAGNAQHEKLEGFSFDEGEFIESFKNIPDEQLVLPINIKQNLEKALAKKINIGMSELQKYENLKNDITPFVIDVKIDVQSEAKSNKLVLYLYNIKMVVGWFEQRNGVWHLTSDTYASRVATDQRPSIIGKI